MRFPFAVGLVTVLSCSHGPALRVDGVDASTLRAEGPAGLEKALTALDRTTDPAERARLIDVITKVAGQKDAHVSRLYWYEDLDHALAAAKQSGKPVLSLRMLG